MFDRPQFIGLVVGITVGLILVGCIKCLVNYLKGFEIRRKSDG